MSNQREHILGSFQRALNELTTDLNRMSELVLQNLENSIRGLLERDDAICAQAIADDEEIDQFEVRIDREGLNIIMLYSPVASDLRKVVSVMKVSSNLERVADQTVGIAKRARKINKLPEVAETRLVEPVYEKASHLLRQSLKAFREGDLTSALEVKAMDKDLDKNYKAVAKQLTTRMEEDTAHLRSYLDLQFVIRFLERVGDHAKNIAEDAVFAEAAVDIRHGADRSGLEGQADQK